MVAEPAVAMLSAWCSDSELVGIAIKDRTMTFEIRQAFKAIGADVLVDTAGGGFEIDVLRNDDR